MKKLLFLGLLMPLLMPVLAMAQSAFDALLLTRIQPGLRSCLYIGTRLRGSLSLLPQSARLGGRLSLLAHGALLAELMRLYRTIDHCRRLGVRHSHYLRGGLRCCNAGGGRHAWRGYTRRRDIRRCHMCCGCRTRRRRPGGCCCGPCGCSFRR